MDSCYIKVQVLFLNSLTTLEMKDFLLRHEVRVVQQELGIDVGIEPQQNPYDDMMRFVQRRRYNGPRDPYSLPTTLSFGNRYATSVVGEHYTDG